jgi:hypothetical protein
MRLGIFRACSARVHDLASTPPHYNLVQIVGGEDGPGKAEWLPKDRVAPDHATIDATDANANGALVDKARLRQIGDVEALRPLQGAWHGRQFNLIRDNV